MSQPISSDLDSQTAGKTVEVPAGPPSTVNEAYPTLLPQKVKTQTAPILGTFGDYDLLQEIARGGMGVVYRARQRGLQRMVALKMILSGHQATSEDVERFCMEARAAANLDHPNIVPVYEIGCQENQHYFTMAFIEGDSLAGLIRKKNIELSFKEMASIIQAMAEAIQYAHEQGIIHRDLKPENVLIDHHGRPRITDFGLARRLEVDSRLTASGAVLGTPSYMAPEQAMGDNNSGPAVDIHALGGILYFMLTGQPPYEGKALMETLLKVVNEVPVPPRQINPAVPAALEAICLKCLEKTVAKRYATAALLGDALQAWVSQIAPEPSSTQPLSARIKAVAAGKVLPPSAATAQLSAPAAPQKSYKMWPWVAAAVVVIGIIVAAPRIVSKWGRASGIQDSGIEENASSQNDGPSSQEEPAREIQAVGFTKPEKMRRDFGLHFDMVGGNPGPKDERSVADGTKLVFKIKVDRDAYVGVWAIDADGDVVQIFPNKYESNHLLTAGREYTVPGVNTYTFDTTTSKGLEHVWAVASTKPWSDLEGRRDAGPYAQFQSPEEREKWQRHVRKIVITPVPAKNASPTEEAVAEEIIPYRVRANLK